MDGETTKAVAKAAGDGFGTKAIEAVSSVGAYLAKTVGTIPEDVLGVAGGDWLHEQRRRHLAAMKAKTAAILDRIGAKTVTSPSPSVVVPLLQAAADEGRPELQDLWAALLASALQQDGGTRVRRAFFDTLKGLEPDDAKLFGAVMAHHPHGQIKAEDAGDAPHWVGLDGAAAAVAWQALERAGLIDRFHSGDRKVTAFGAQFWRACNP